MNKRQEGKNKTNKMHISEFYLWKAYQQLFGFERYFDFVYQWLFCQH